MPIDSEIQQAHRLFESAKEATSVNLNEDTARQIHCAARGVRSATEDVMLWAKKADEEAREQAVNACQAAADILKEQYPDKAKQINEWIEELKTFDPNKELAKATG
ncbi:hypothetical protein KKF55_01800 [Patescibacteria group bacterium]|nr:hypothetical protein [Patescibacteria group bacterium]